MESHGGRRGLAIKDMTTDQQALAHGLLSTALSHPGYLQAVTIMALESILRDLEGGDPTRDPAQYHVAVHGTPAPTDTWGWSFEGHHLSVNVTLVNGQAVRCHAVLLRQQPRSRARWCAEGLGDSRRRTTVGTRTRSVAHPGAAEAGDHCRGGTERDHYGSSAKVDKDRFLPPQGIPFDQLDANQQVLLLKLVSEFAGKYRQPIVAQIEQRSPLTDGQGMYFAWAGSIEPGHGHYYRIQTPRFLFEYDNTQNNANHVHTVWRDFDGDFGEDLLRKHYETSNHHTR